MANSVKTMILFTESTKTKPGGQGGWIRNWRVSGLQETRDVVVRDWTIVNIFCPKVDESIRGSYWKKRREREKVEGKMDPII